MPPARPEDEAAHLYDAFGASLYRYAVMILADREAAEDVIQQVFVSVIARGLSGVDDPERYLRRAVRNGCYSALRQRRLGNAQAAGRVEDLLEVVPGTPDLIGGEVRLALAAAIRRLPADQREALHLHVFEGLTFREIAGMTGDPPNTIASRYRYALEKLRHALRE